MNEQISQLEQRVRELETFIKSLQSSSSIPLAIDQAFRSRLGNINLVSNSKSASSENQAVAESGSASYSVLKPPDGFTLATLSDTGQQIYLPYFL
jgi:hypothetical protein